MSATSLFNPLGVLVLLAVLAMSGAAALWFGQGQQYLSFIRRSGLTRPG